ncbi:MAG: bacterioferritin [Anaerolineales bacterium]|nr:MAG: bacterioferritin [Anaerolineales bacterium]
MKGNDALIGVLNDLLSDELTAVNQYMLHSEMCAHWGFQALHKAIEKRAIDEMKHSEWLISRILFLEGLPNVTKYQEIKIGKSVPEMIANDSSAEDGAIAAYNRGIALASEVGDEATADLLIKILDMEEGHIDWAEKQQAMIKQIGLENYLAAQLGGE